MMREMQVRYLRRRHGLPEPTARLLAVLHYGERGR